MKKLVTLLTGLFLSGVSFSQSWLWKVSSDIIDFGDCPTTAKVVRSFWVVNNHTESLQITCLSSDTSFKLNAGNALIAAYDSALFEVSLTPYQNILYKGVIAVYANVTPGLQIVELKGSGKFKEAYYATTFNLWDEALKAELKKITGQGYVSLGYNTARDYMYGTIDNKNGWVTCVYTGRTAQFNTRSGATANNFNCEHTWPQSLFSSNEPMKSDIHHLYPTDDAANSKRDNDPFGIVSNPSWSVGGSKWANNTFEPRNEQKGNTARSMLYMAMRYENYSGFLTSQEQVLRNWCSTFLPDAAAIARNEAIYGYQKNRNPFVDHPEYLDRILSISTTANRNTIKSSWYASQTDKVVLRPLLIREKNDVITAIFCNNGTSAFTINAVVPPQNGAIDTGFKKNLAPGEFSIFKFKEDGNLVMDKHYSIATSIGTFTDSLRFEIKPVTGNILSVNNQSFWYPNPSLSGKFVHHNNSVEGHILIFSTTGQLVFSTEITSEFTEIDLSAFKNGVYFAQYLNSIGISKELLMLNR